MGMPPPPPRVFSALRSVSPLSSVGSGASSGLVGLTVNRSSEDERTSPFKRGDGPGVEEGESSGGGESIERGKRGGRGGGSIGGDSKYGRLDGVAVCLPVGSCGDSNAHDSDDGGESDKTDAKTIVSSSYPSYSSSSNIQMSKNNNSNNHSDTSLSLQPTPSRLVTPSPSISTVIQKSKRAATSLFLILHAQHCRSERCSMMGCDQMKVILAHVLGGGCTVGPEFSCGFKVSVDLMWQTEEGALS